MPNERNPVPHAETESTGCATAGGDLYIVGVGASAGGLEALEKMFGNIPPDTGMAFVVVQHLSPDFKSLMNELLARHTKMPIRRVEDGMPVEPNSIYLIPPKKEMIISGGRLLLTDKDPSQTLTLPIDHFFRSLAQDAGRRSIAVVLSGTGSDGSRGIGDIHEAGGLVVAQSEASAKFDGMPKAAMETAIVDVAVAPEEIAEVLARYANHPFRAQWASERERPVDESSLEHIFRLLKQRHKIDFNCYKPTTIGRRLERRIQLNHTGSMEDYVDQLESDPRELDLLYKDLLIGVTRFFRDREAFEVLEKDVLPQMLSRLQPSNELRVWVAACGTGEEAYSLAMLIDECMERMDRRLHVKIFATDVHRASLDVAHVGLYSAASVTELNPDRLARYFTQLDGGYQVRPELRKMIVFAPHDLVKDAPFTRLHMISCRNFLIYLRGVAQKKVFSLFHFGLTTGGVLLLGASESPGELADEFVALDERWKLFRKRRDIRLPPDMRSLPLDPAAYQHPTTPMAPRRVVPDRELMAAYDELLDRFMPAGLLVGEHREIVHMFGGAGRYLKLPDGRLSNNLLELVGGDLKLALVGALQRIGKGEESVTFQRIRVHAGDGEEFVRLNITPVGSHQTMTKYLVTFETLDQPAPPLPDGAQIDVSQLTRDQIRDLEVELRYTKENLQATIEELETSNEELQATNEELTASNEELQSTNEELHSVNEELYTVNAEYQKKISELTELTNDMDNLLLSTDVHTLFLDSSLCIRKFTPKMAEAFNLVPGDLGRRIEGFTNNICCSDLTDKLARVLEAGQQYEEQVDDHNGHHFIMRILPYMADVEASGVVLTLIDITERQQIGDALAQSERRYALAVQGTAAGVWEWEPGSDTYYFSRQYARLLGYEPEELPGTLEDFHKRLHPDDHDRVWDAVNAHLERNTNYDEEFRLRLKSGRYHWFRSRGDSERDASGQAVRMAGAISDIDRRKRAEAKTQREIRRRDNFLAMLSHELRNPMAAVLSALDALSVGRLLDTAKPSDDRDVITDGLETHSTGDGRATFTVDFEALDVINRQTRHMARLLDDLLDVARIKQNRIEFRKEIVDLDAGTGAVLECVQHMFDAKQQTLHLVAGDQPLLVEGDPARLRQVQVNLLANASKYTPAGGEAWFEIRRDGHEALLTVRDSGEGIPQRLLHRIFDLFVQSQTSLARSSGGLGLGLSLAQSIVEAHGGTIVAYSPGRDQGSTFEVRLPLTDKPLFPAQADPKRSFEGRKLLLVEDNEDAREMLAKTLRFAGFEVMDAPDGPQALEILQAFSPDVAVVDIGLPGMDGYELAPKIRKSAGDDIRLIALTGYGRDEDKQEAASAGFEVHLVKPFDPSKLYQALSILGTPAVQDC